MKKGRTWRWVSRDKESDVVYVWPRGKPVEQVSGYWNQEGGYVVACVSEFKRLFGFTILEGECKKVEFTARIV